MEIEYIFPDDDDNQKRYNEQIRKRQQQDTIGCLIMALFLLGGVFIFLTLLPFFLLVLGYSIVFLGLYIVYKAYLEIPVLNLIQKLKSRH